MKQIHGVADAIKIAAISSEHQSVRVIDRVGGVELCLSANSYPAFLTVEQANFIAEQLIASAKRVETKKK